MILIIFNILVLLSTKEALKCPIKENHKSILPYPTISLNITLKSEDISTPKTNNSNNFQHFIVHQRTPIMKFLVLGEIFRGKRKVPDEEELDREGEGEGEGERGRGVRERST
ncbi:hypothetical protein AMTRI_Chr05g64060 [Amborella trichopoda]